MDKTTLKEIILEQKKNIEHVNLGQERENLSRIKKYLNFPHSVIISGIRRSGKSTLLAQIIDKFYGGSNIYYLNFEDERLIDFQLKDFNTLYELYIELFGENKIFFFDEIQNIQKWEIFIRRMQDNGFKFFLTGSNASLLSKELGAKLTGRSIPIELYPFSFREYLLFKGYSFTEKKIFLTSERGEIKRYFNEYLENGGMPEYLKYKDAVVLKNVYENVLYRDIVARYELKEIKALRELGLYFLSNIGGLFSYNKLKNNLNLGSANTIKNYTGYLEDSFLVFTINSFSYSLKQQMIAPKKIYCVDNGLANAVSFRFSKDRGKFLENLVLGELKRMDNNIYYYKTHNNLEVDFLIRKGTKIDNLIQVAQSLSNENTRIREINSLVAAMEELKVNKGLILTEDTEERFKIKGKLISVIPVYKWLLQ